MKISFSSQAMAVIENLKDFNEEAFILWLNKQGYPVGSKTVLDYVVERDRLETGKPRAGKEVVINAK